MHYSKPVREAINFINENLTANISLETLAEHIHFSPYHFHRLFLLHVGETPMEYIRRQRLRSASRDLLSNQLSIIEIAAEYGFESPDGFCRAFKRYYGVTPGDYRKLNLKKPDNSKLIEEVENIMYDINIYERLVCSKEEKKKALRTLDKILQLAEQAKSSGLLSLESEIDRVEPEIFKNSLEMLLDGVEAIILKEILLNYTLCGNYKGKELLKRILIIEGILGIQQDTNSLILKEKLSSFFGEDFINEINKHFGSDEDTRIKKIETFICENQDKPAHSKETSLLEEPFNRMDTRSLQRLLREINNYTLVTAISGSSGKTQIRVLKNVSKKLAVLLIGDMGARKTLIASEISNSQKQVIETMHGLRNQGDIVM